MELTKTLLTNMFNVPDFADSGNIIIYDETKTTLCRASCKNNEIFIRIENDLDLSVDVETAVSFLIHKAAEKKYIQVIYFLCCSENIETYQPEWKKYLSLKPVEKIDGKIYSCTFVWPFYLEKTANPINLEVPKMIRQ